MTFERLTVGGDVVFEGLGLHSGVPVRVVVRSSRAGVVFRWGQQQVAADPAGVTDTSRCTRLGEISTVEHLMAAFAGLEITDAEVEVSAPELPALDGAAREYVDGLLAAGVERVGSLQVEGPFARVFLHEEPLKIAISSGVGHWRYEFETGDRWPGRQSFEALDAAAAFPDQIAPARTFGFAEEIPALLERGLARGLGPKTALVLGPSGYEGAARFADEPARHKLLDCIGDLYLTGIPIRALNVVAERTGHRAHVEAAKLLAEAVTVVREA
ncbi:MAG: UDP-3-O-acyl-N-acetylglucosamine deacetylase [Fimbriimonadaceae bacterium]|nr:UDP-3-O-acyl-N-acetylglucosamine deacetylase [Fimbriimonadaceae bacterium]